MFELGVPLVMLGWFFVAVFVAALMSAMLVPIFGRYLSHGFLVVVVVVAAMELLLMPFNTVALCLILVFAHATYLNTVKVGNSPQVRTLKGPGQPSQKKSPEK